MVKCTKAYQYFQKFQTKSSFLFYLNFIPSTSAISRPNSLLSFTVYYKTFIYFLLVCVSCNRGNSFPSHSLLLGFLHALPKKNCYNFSVSRLNEAQQQYDYDKCVNMQIVKNSLLPHISSTTTPMKCEKSVYECGYSVNMQGSWVDCDNIFFQPWYLFPSSFYSSKHLLSRFSCSTLPFDARYIELQKIIHLKLNLSYRLNIFSSFFRRHLLRKIRIMCYQWCCCCYCVCVCILNLWKEERK